MAITVYDGARNLIVHSSNIDGTAETDLQLFDPALLVPIPESLVLWKARFSVSGAGVALSWAGATAAPMVYLTGGGPGELDYSRYGGLPNTATDPTGIVLLNFAAGNGYMMTLEFKKHGFFGWNYAGPV